MSDDEVSYNTLFNQRLKNIKYHSRPEPKPPEKPPKQKINNIYNHVTQTPAEEPKKPKPEKLIPALNEIYNRAIQKEKVRLHRGTDRLERKSSCNGHRTRKACRNFCRLLRHRGLS